MLVASPPAASATERVVTASGPSVASRCAATSTSCARFRSRDDTGFGPFTLSMITEVCELKVSSDNVVDVSLVTQGRQHMIVITGATGVLNGATVEHLLKRVPADQVGVSVRDVAKAQ